MAALRRREPVFYRLRSPAASRAPVVHGAGELRSRSLQSGPASVDDGRVQVAVSVVERDEASGTRHDDARRRARRLVPLCLLALSTCGRADAVAVVVSQGTDISVAARAGELVIDLAGRLWRIPAAGGEAVAITPATEFARRPAFSPDGGRLAWQSLREGVFQVMVSEATGANPRQLTSGAWNHLSPSWSPDGRRIAFASDRGGDFGIWEIETDTGALTQLTFEPGHELDPAWEPSGRSLAYVSELAGRHALVLRTPFRPPRELVANGRLLRGPAWRPDGTVISFAASGPQGTRLNMLILSDPPVVKPLSRAEAAFQGPVSWLDREHLVYAADGMIRQREFGAVLSSEIPFTARLDVKTAPAAPTRSLQAPDRDFAVRGLAGFTLLPNRHLIVSALGDLWELDADGTLVRRLTNDAFLDRDPAATVDGRHLAFVSDRDGSPQVWRMDLGTGDRDVLTAEPGFAARPAWSAAGDRIAYLAGPAGRTGAVIGLALRIVDVATLEVTDIGAGLVAPGTPAWVPGDTHVGLVGREQGSARLVLYPAAGGAARRVTLPNEALGDGAAEAQWSGDGQSLLIASSAGVRVLPMLGPGLVGADWRSLADAPARRALWLPGEDAALFSDGEGLGRVAAGVEPRRIALPLTWRPAAASGRTVIRGARVFDSARGEYLAAHDVVIDGGRIAAVGPQAEVGATRGDLVIEASGKTILPGLIDLAVHLPADAGARVGSTLLAYGITTAQAVSTPGVDLRELAELWQAHGAGPRLLQSPEWCGGPLATPDVTLPTGAVRLCPTAVGGIETPSAPAGQSTPAFWAPSWLGALYGHAGGIAPPGLAPPTPARTALLGTGGLYQDAIDVILRSGAVLVTGLAPRALPLLVEEQPGLLESTQYRNLVAASEREARARDWRAALNADRAFHRSSLRDEQRLIGRLVAGGGQLALASGSPATPYGLGLHAELRLLVGAGLTRADVLRMATAHAAEALGLQGELGSVAPGQQADLLIVEGDPLADLGDLLRIDTVIVAGRVLPFATLAGPALEKFTAPPPNTRSKQARRRH